MLTLREFIKENADGPKVRPGGKSLPNEPGTTPIPDGHVRLYHQTSEDNLDSIEKHGIRMSSAKGIEGPKGIYSDPHGFYGSPFEKPSVEFSVPKEEWEKATPSLQRDIKPHEIIGVHRPWHNIARSLIADKRTEEVKSGKVDDVLDYDTPDKQYRKALDHIKNNY